MQFSNPSFVFALSMLFGINNAATYANITSTSSNVTTSTSSKKVFAHYMAGTTTQAHVNTDIIDAISMGLDGFALNVGNPLASYTNDTLTYMFDYAATTDFKLFISIDLSGAAGACLGLSDFTSLLQKYIDHPAYFRGPNGAPFISGYGDGGLTNANWTEFLSSIANETYFVPNFDATEGYYAATTNWWDYWGDVVDGLFSWESNWPQDPATGVGAAYAGDISLDEIVINGSAAHNKSYMIGLSPLQYKDAYDSNYYREGGLNFVIRMEKILNMSTSPDFAEILTWNNGPESHYIGNLWAESNTDYRPSFYSGSSWDHTAWQPIFSSFITAFKAQLPATEMTVPEIWDGPEYAAAVGALWYKTILQDSVCNNVTYNKNSTWTVDNSTGCAQSVAPDNYYYPKPTNFDNGTDAHNWAVVLDPLYIDRGYILQTLSNDVVIGNTTLVGGLNYGSFDGIKAGKQRMKIVDSNGETVMGTEDSRKGVNASCSDGIYNMNYEVLALR